MKDRMPVARLIVEAIDRTEYDAVLLAEFMGERKLANLYKLIDQARGFDNQSDMFALSDFIAQLSEFVANQPDEPLAATQSETMDVVRLMTIHQAKGLEFPLVFVPDVARPSQSPKAFVAFSPELGPLLKDDEASVGYDLYSLEEKEETKAETTRLLYVAATRAADYLILSSGLENPQKTIGPWMELLARRFDLFTGKAHQLNVQVKVTASMPSLQNEPPDATSRQPLEKILAKAKKKAEKGQGRLPKYLAPIAPDQSARRQFSFSRLSGILHGDRPNFRGAMPGMVGENGTVPFSVSKHGTVPLFMPLEEDYFEPALDPLGVGTLVHAVLEAIDFTNPGDFAAIIRRLAPSHIADGDCPDVNLPIDMIGRFLTSARAAQIAAAKEVRRELEFLLAWPPENPQTGGRYLQGFIDCLYRDPAGAWHILDYKTNNITAQTLQQEAAKYEMQMLVYALAAEKILQQLPAELVLYFLRPGLEYQFDWNDDARDRVVEMVDQLLP